MAYQPTIGLEIFTPLDNRFANVVEAGSGLKNQVITENSLNYLTGQAQSI